MGKVRSYREVMKEALQLNRERIDTLVAFEKIIGIINSLVGHLEKEDGVSEVSVVYPAIGDDYLFVIVYLSEKGVMQRDIGGFIRKFVLETNSEYLRDPSTNANKMTKVYSFGCNETCYAYNDDVKNPRIEIKVDASKAETCHQVDTGKTAKIYEWVCEEEGTE